MSDGRGREQRTAAGGVPLWKGWLPLLLYHGVFLLFALVYGPIVAWRIAFDGRYRRSFGARMGRVEPSPPGRPVLWFHGVSVGEVKGLAVLVQRVAQAHPEFGIVVSATTPTGHALASRLYSGHRVIHYPIDFGLFPGRALDRVRPACVVLMEQEIWPNFLQAAARRGIPVVIVNGRISERSFRGYRAVRPLLPQLDWIRLFCVQTETYRNRWRALRIPDERIAVTGNLKYDGVTLGNGPAGAIELRHWLAPDERLVLVCGSTHGHEEEWLADAARAVAARRGWKLRVVLVPRHPDRAGAIVDALRGRGHAVSLWSRVGEPPAPLADDAVLLVDTIGQLESFYAACDVAFVGGSLVPHGGQNMLEPAALGRAVLFGPHVANFRADVELLLESRAAVQIADLRQLEAELERLLGDPALRAALGARAVAMIVANRGAVDRTREILAPLLRDAVGHA
ncbi:MAG: 3-deoxy-D-manno-octulosonic acid transferase [Planctomycetes bacterium]|nr:3-deoxy-D-manno-octulosonic acid transferase [Planctomycetota bacterium]